MPFQNTTKIRAILLAGGQGRRVGYQDKGLLPYRDRPMIAWMAEAISDAVDETIISCNRNQAAYQRYANQVVCDDEEFSGFQGPIAGILSAAKRINDDCEYLLVLPCDNPHIDTDIVARMHSALMDSDAANATEIVIADDGERLQYLHLMMRVSALPSLADYYQQDGRAVKHWVHSRRFKAVDFSDKKQSFRNLNSGKS